MYRRQRICMRPWGRAQRSEWVSFQRDIARALKSGGKITARCVCTTILKTAYFGLHVRVEKNLSRRGAGQVTVPLRVRDISIRQVWEVMSMRAQVVRSCRFIPIRWTMQTGLRSRAITEVRRHSIFRGRSMDMRLWRLETERSRIGRI